MNNFITMPILARQAMQNARYIVNTDGYKYTHYGQYPDGTTKSYAYYESRKGAKFNKTLFFGLQYYLKKFYEGQVITKDGIDWAEEFAYNYFGTLEGTFNRPMWEHILNKHGGKPPIEIMAVPEGTRVDVNNSLMTVVNRDDLCWQLTSHVETMLSMLWFPCSTATLAWELKKMIKDYMLQTCDDLDLLNYSMHNFGFRAGTCLEASEISSAGHLLSFVGSDTPPGATFLMDWYGAPMRGLIASVVASEHSIMTSLGREGEEKLVRDLLRKYPNGILSLVIDSFNYRNFVEMIGTKFKDEVIARGKRGGKLVLRPDSGDPVTTTIEVIEGIEKNFGSFENKKRYNELPPYIGALWGDGIRYDGVRNILFALKSGRWATKNVIYGMGNGLIDVERDTQRFAFKSSAQERNGEWHDIWKEPLDPSKTSKKGRLKLGKHPDGYFVTVNQADPRYRDIQVPVFRDGEILQEYSYEDIKANIEKS